MMTRSYLIAVARGLTHAQAVVVELRDIVSILDKDPMDMKKQTEIRKRLAELLDGARKDAEHECRTSATQTQEAAPSDLKECPIKERWLHCGEAWCLTHFDVCDEGFKS